jgi:squalene synthase HpnC
VQYLLPEQFVYSADHLTRIWSAEESERYTRWLATSHYENFHVVSFLLPRRLHQDFYNIYAFCRWSDDLGDEIADKDESLRLLAWWRGLLDRLYREREASHPVFVALRRTVQKHSLPQEPFSDLIHAFVHDQRVSRYQNWEEVFGYCRYSANPVGRLLLYLCGYSDGERQRLSDSTCTALQLANFWQDVSVDLKKDRVYIPIDLMDRHGCSVRDLFEGHESPAFQAVMRDAVNTARELFLAGLPLVGMVDRRLSLDIDLFSRGGMKVLDKIEQMQYRVLHRRPAVSKTERVGLLLSSLVRSVLPKAA